MRTNVIHLQVTAEDDGEDPEPRPIGWVEFERQNRKVPYEPKAVQFITGEERLKACLQGFFFPSPRAPTRP
jgi:hypothetical protein